MEKDVDMWGQTQVWSVQILVSQVSCTCYYVYSSTSPTLETVSMAHAAVCT